MESIRSLLHDDRNRVWEAELYRLKGALLLPSGGMHSGVCWALAASGHGASAEAEAAFQQVLATARRQQAKSLELRVALRLSRLWQQQGKRTEAHALLAPIDGWFTEGFDTADLQEVQALLEEREG